MLCAGVKNMLFVFRLIVVVCLSGSFLAQANPAALSEDIQSVKRSVLELNKDLYALEQDLLSPATTRAAFYFSLSYGEFFEPLSIEITAKGIDPVQHIYTERQVKALRMGAVQPLAQLNMGPGSHELRAVVRGVDHLGQNRELVVEEVVEKSDQPLLLEIVISDQSERKNAVVKLKHW